MSMKRYAPLAAILVVTTLVMSIEVASPFVRPHDYASSAFATIARNHVEFGLGATRGASILVVDRDDPSHSPVYAHHPFGYPLLLASVFSVLGANEWAARLPAIACSLGAIVFLYLLMERWFDRRTAILAAGAYAFTPVNLFYGRLVSLEQPVVFLIVATVWAWFRWLERRHPRDFAIVALLLVLGMLTEWQAYYFCFLLPAHYWLVARRSSPTQDTGPTRQRGKGGADASQKPSPETTSAPPRWRVRLVSCMERVLGVVPWELLAILALGPAMFGFFLGHLAWADLGHVEELKHVFLHRLGGSQPVETVVALGGDASYTFGEFIARLSSHFVLLILPPLVFAAAGAAIGLVILVRRNQVSCLAATIPALLLAPAIGHTILFHRTLYIHDCLVILYLPGIAALGGIGLRRLCVTTKVTDFRFLGAAAIIIWFLAGTIRETMLLHAESYLHATYLGHQLADLTQPGDEIVVVGTRYHPAVEWYARRDVHFLDTSGPLAEIIARDRPNRLVVFPLRDGIDEDPGPDRATRLVVARTKEARRYADSHGRELFRDSVLLLVDLPPEPDAPGGTK